MSSGLDPGCSCSSLPLQRRVREGTGIRQVARHLLLIFIPFRRRRARNERGYGVHMDRALSCCIGDRTGGKSVAYRYSLSPVGHVQINMDLAAVTCVCKWVGVGSKGEESCAVGLLEAIDRRRFG